MGRNQCRVPHFSRSTESAERVGGPAFHELCVLVLNVRSVKKTCVHIVHPDGRLIPFDTYNLFYRDDLEKTRLDPLRRRAEAALAPIG